MIIEVLEFEGGCGFNKANLEPRKVGSYSSQGLFLCLLKRPLCRTVKDLVICPDASLPLSLRPIALLQKEVKLASHSLFVLICCWLLPMALSSRLTVLDSGFILHSVSGNLAVPCTVPISPPALPFISL